MCDNTVQYRDNDMTCDKKEIIKKVFFLKEIYIKGCVFLLK